MKLEQVESIIQWLGGCLAYATLAVLLYGVYRGSLRQAGRASGQMWHWLRSPWFYLVTSTLFFGVCILGWSPLPLNFSSPARVWSLVIGSLLFYPGMSLLLWGRLALGRNYFVSTSLGAQLFAGQPLVTSGPYALVRHPMYLGLILAAFGSLLIYVTWTALLFACFSPLIVFRARREEKVLSAEFGEQWQEYCRRVPAFLPKVGKKANLRMT